VHGLKSSLSPAPGEPAPGQGDECYRAVPVLTRQGLQGGMGMSAEAAMTNASATLVIKKIFFNMLKSPWGFNFEFDHLSNPSED
jgi:hypothetical protein